MKTITLFGLLCALPLLLLGQDSLQAGTFVVRKIHQGDFIPDGLGFLGNMGGGMPGGGKGGMEPIIIKGKVMRVFEGDTTPIRSASVWQAETTIYYKSDSSGAFTISVPNDGSLMVDGDSLIINIRHQTDWDTTITIAFANNTDEYIVTRYIPDAPTQSRMSAKERRRELLKRIFLPWKWFQQKDKLPPRKDSL